MGIPNVKLAICPDDLGSITSGDGPVIITVVKTFQRSVFEVREQFVRGYLKAGIGTFVDSLHGGA